MTSRWYVTHNGKTHGPYTNAEIKRLTAEGRITPADILWLEGTEPQVELVPLPVPAIPAAPPAPGPKPDWLQDVERVEQSLAAPGQPAAQPEPPRKPALPDWLKDVRRGQQS